MKNFFVLGLMVFFMGCAYEGKSFSQYMNDPRSFIKDPHFEEYKVKRDELESQYLKKEIEYSDYVEQMNDLDAKYMKEVNERNSKLEGPKF